MRSKSCWSSEWHSCCNGKFEFYYGVTLGELILKHTDNLSKTLQHKTISAAEGQECASLTLRTLQSVRSDDTYV